MSTDLGGKAVVITGAGQGLGRAYALASARAGASVVVSDVQEEAAERVAAEIRAQGGRAVASVGSVSDWDQAKAAVDLSFDEFGALDGYVANAAIMHMAKPWLEEERRLRAIVEVNVLGVMFGVGHALAAMVESGNAGSIVTVVSGAAFGIPGMSAYGATKGAVASMTLNWAIEGAEHGIRVNAVSPWAMTTMTSDHLDQSKADPSTFPTPEAIAPVVVSLLSDETRPVTGALIRFDGKVLSAYEHVRPLIGERAEWTVDEVSTALRAQFTHDVGVTSDAGDLPSTSS